MMEESNEELNPVEPDNSELPDEPNEGSSISESILNSVKKLLGIEPDYTEFDVDITMNINAAFFTLKQLGVGPDEGYMISGPDATYSEFLQGNDYDINQIKMYLFYKTKLGFDPPQSSIVTEAVKEMIKETEWRLNVQFENYKWLSDGQENSEKEEEDAPME